MAAGWAGNRASGFLAILTGWLKSNMLAENRAVKLVLGHFGPDGDMGHFSVPGLSVLSQLESYGIVG
jgi:hypothetical protein